MSPLLFAFCILGKPRCEEFQLAWLHYGFPSPFGINHWHFVNRVNLSLVLKMATSFSWLPCPPIVLQIGFLLIKSVSLIAILSVDLDVLIHKKVHVHFATQVCPINKSFHSLGEFCLTIKFHRQDVIYDKGRSKQTSPKSITLFLNKFVIVNANHLRILHFNYQFIISIR